MNTVMRTWLLVAGLGAALVLGSVTLRAATDPNTDTNAPAQSSDPNASNDRGLPEVSGTIKAIDLSAGTITVKGLFLSKIITVRPEAQISVEGKANATLNDLQVGDRVMVTYHRNGQMLIADKITRSEASRRSNGSSPSSSSSASGSTQ
ncbi:MAG TPA: hypothetical protein VMP11_13550 [Verrucomicrobiae bacterium]|nr:hypothetical protein [Verrucomicrobiae bacterium]